MLIIRMGDLYEQKTFLRIKSDLLQNFSSKRDFKTSNDGLF